MKIKFINATVLTVNENFDVLYNSSVEIENNKIIYVGKERDSLAERIIDCNNNILMPGLINTHAHLAMSLFKGIGDYASFYDWWPKYMKPLEEKLQASDCYVGVALSCFELIKNGITTVLDCYMFHEETVKAVQNMGIRAGICFGAITGNENITQSNLKLEYENLLKNSNIIPVLYAHSTYSCDENQFSQLLKFALKNKLTFTTHASETLEEVGQCDKKNGVTPIALLESYGMFETNCILAHCTYGDKEDSKIISTNKVTVATNPSSNLKLGSGIAPIYSYLKNDVNISLGTDGSASNNSLDILKEMFLVATLSSGMLNKPDAVRREDAIKMATINGAKALNIPNLGSIKEGYLADIIMLDVNCANMQPLNNIISNIVYCANTNNVCLTMVNGKIVYENGNYFVCENLQDIVKKANEIINKLKAD